MCNKDCHLLCVNVAMKTTQRNNTWAEKKHICMCMFYKTKPPKRTSARQILEFGVVLCQASVQNAAFCVRVEIVSWEEQNSKHEWWQEENR